MTSYPSVLQIEPTTDCNFNCQMCLHASRPQAAPAYFDSVAFARLAEEVFPHLKRLVLYGWGEPLLHPRFFELLGVARSGLSSEATLFVTTNGSLLSHGVCERLAGERLLDEIAISCDSITPAGGAAPGHEEAIAAVLENIEYLNAHRNRADLKIGIEATVMQSNFRGLPDMVERFGRYGIDYISVGHLYPYYENLADECLYCMLSAEALPILEEIGERGLDLMSSSSRNFVNILNRQVPAEDEGSRQV
ncbi:MAG: radical SAM protein, partial [Deltaproteobacteria bacterium]|nr:radical SAM protein [Deltaproteobacteria bacterium]